MPLADIRTLRMASQQISGTAFSQPEEIVSWLGAMQAQEYAMAKWAIALRLKGINDADIEEAFNSGKIIRTHMLRPTWHFVSPHDLRWLLELTAPHVHALNAYMYRQLELDAKTFKKSNDVLSKVLDGGKLLTRTDLQAELKKVKIIADGHRLSYIMMQAELDRIICSGPRKGKQFTYALLEERVKKSESLSREEGLAELAKRFFMSRGPATVQDLAYWSGLSLKDVKAGIASLGNKLKIEMIDKQEYIVTTETSPAIKHKLETSFLMPDYDEYGMSYKERSFLSGTLKRKHDAPMFNRFIVLDGKIEGSWQRTVKSKTTETELVPFAPFNKTQQQKAEKAEKRFKTFALD